MRFPFSYYCLFIGKKKGNAPKGSVQEVVDLESLTISDTPSTSEAPPPEETEEGLTGAAKRRKKKEQKRAEKEAKKDEATGLSEPTEADTKPPTEEISKPQEAPKASEPAKPQESSKPPVEEEDGGLGLGIGGGRKKHPRRKKGVDAAKGVETTAAGAQVQGMQMQPSTSGLAPAPAASQPGIAAAPPALIPSDAPVPRTTPIEVESSVKPAQGTPWNRRPGPAPMSAGIGTTGGFEGPGPSIAPASVQEPVQTSLDTGTARQTKSEVACRFKIPKKIIGNAVPATPVRVLTNYLPMNFKVLQIVSPEQLLFIKADGLVLVYRRG